MNENESIPLIKESTILKTKKKTALKLATDSSESFNDSSKLSWKQLNEHDSSDEDIPLSKIVKMKRKKTDSASSTVKSTAKSDGSQSSFSETGSIFGNKRPLSMFEKLEASCGQKETTENRVDSPTRLLNLNKIRFSSSDTSPSEEDLPAIFSSPIKSKQQIADRTKEILLAASKTPTKTVSSQSNVNSRNNEKQDVESITPLSSTVVTKISTTKAPIPKALISSSASDKNSRVSSLRSFTEQIENTATESDNSQGEISSENCKPSPITKDCKTKKGRKKRVKSIEMPNLEEATPPAINDKKKSKKKKNKVTEAKSTQKSSSKKKKDSSVVTPSNDEYLSNSANENSVKTTPDTMLSLDDTNELLDRLEQQDSSLAEMPVDQSVSLSKTSSSSNVKSMKVQAVSVKVKNIQTRSKSKRTSKKQIKSQVRIINVILVFYFILVFFCLSLIIVSQFSTTVIIIIAELAKDDQITRSLILFLNVSL